MKSIQSASYQVLTSMLKQKRIQMSITQDELAEKINQDQTYVSKYETGERRVDVVELREICEALGIDLVEFIKEFQENAQSS